MLTQTTSLLFILFSFSQGVPNRIYGTKWQHRALNPSPHPDPYIVGGEVVQGREFPAQVSIRVEGAHSCGGSILNEEWIVTAAHCTRWNVSMYEIVAGSNKLSQGGTKYNVTDIRAHKKFGTTPSKAFDIAVMKVSPKIKMGDGVDVVKLPESHQPPPEVGTNATVIGWGDIYNFGPLSDDLLKLVEPIYNHDTCSNVYLLTEDRPVDNNQICAGGEGGKDACNGDSGDPLFVNNEMIGIVSWGLPCAHNGYPTVYTLVSDFIEWINVTITS